MKNSYKIISRSFISVVLQIVPLFLSGQMVTFQKVYPSHLEQSSRDVLQTPDGGYLIAGMTGNQVPGDSDLYIVKTNSSGDTLWTKTYGGSQPDYPHSLLPTGDGNYFILGFTASFGAGNRDIWLLKIDPSGNLIWAKTYGGTEDDQGKEIIRVTDGNYLIVGRSNSLNPAMGYNALLMKIDPSGNIIWTKNYGGSLYETGSSVKQCQDGGFVFAGQTFSYGYGDGDMYLVKTNSDGDTLWTKTYGRLGFDEGKYLLANSDGSFTFCCNDSSAGSDFDVRIIKVSGSGNVIWDKTYGGNKKDVCKMIQPTTDGGYIVAAVSRSFGWINPDMWVIRININGDTTWTRHYGGWDHEHCYAARQTPDGGYIVAGHTKSYSPNTEIMLLKLDGGGNVLPTSVPEPLANLIFNVYPNPSRGTISINLDQALSPLACRVSNGLGEVVYSASYDSFIKNHGIIDLENKQPGIYFVTFQFLQGSSTCKLIIE